MTRLILALSIVLFSIGNTAWSCSGRTEGGVDHEDLMQQEAMALELASASEAIALVRVEHVAYSEPGVTVELVKAFKGRMERRAELAWKHDDRYGCKASVSFHNIRVREGNQYLVYLQNGLLRRAAPVSRHYSSISLERELEIIAAVENMQSTRP
jgi:hypothetical protein